MVSARSQILEAAAGVTQHSPTTEQAAAMATDEDVTLVRAGAGAAVRPWPTSRYGLSTVSAIV